MNNRLSVGGILRDIEKASDCVNHGILVNKLQFYGIRGKFLALIQSYLRGRYQKVLTDKFNAYDGVSSGWKRVTSGVLPGSIMGPMLFLIYVNDFPMITDSDSKVAFFADDTSTIITSPNQEGLKIALNKTLSHTISWFKANFLSLNFNKTSYSQFQIKHYIDNVLDINYLNKTIANVPYTKFLGLEGEDTLTWVNHIDQLISRLNSACYVIRAVNVMSLKKALRTLYIFYVHA